jgi:hypothetical protein
MSLAYEENLKTIWILHLLGGRFFAICDRRETRVMKSISSKNNCSAALTYTAGEE